MVKINFLDIDKTQKEIDKALSYADDKCSDLIVTFKKILTTDVEFKANKLDGIESGITSTFMVKPFVDKKTAVLESNYLDSNIIDAAITLAKSSKEVDHYAPLEKSESINKIDNTNKEILDQDVEEMIEISKTAKADDDFKLVESSYTNEIDVSLVATSAGVNESWVECTNHFFAEYAKKEDLFKSHYDWDVDLDFCDTDKIIKTAKEKTDFYFDRSDLINLPKTVIITDKLFLNIIKYLLLENFKASNIEKKNSAFVNKMDDFDSSLNLTIFADKDGFTSSYNVDSFGNAPKELHLIKNGVVTDFAYDFATAKKEGKPITGNSSLTDTMFGNIKCEGKYREVQDAIVVEDVLGLHTQKDFIAGDFALKVVNGYVMKNGSKKALKEFMITGNLFEILRTFISIDKPKKRHSSICGSIATDKIHVSF